MKNTKKSTFSGHRFFRIFTERHCKSTLTHDGRCIYAADSDLNQVAIIDARTDSIVKIITVEKKAYVISRSESIVYAIDMEKYKTD
ncbi:MAG: YncE family protein [Candidatus Brocadia sp.]